MTNRFKAFMSAIYWSHLGWILSTRFNKPPKENYAKRLRNYPKLMLLEKPIGYLAAPVVLAIVCFYVFDLYGLLSFFISTTLLYHGTFCINSLAHMLGDQRFDTGEDSRNHWILNMLTLGGGCIL